MSLETLLLVAFFIVLPLVQMLIKASRRDVLTPKPGQPRRGQPRPAQARPGQPAANGARPAARPQVPPVPAPPHAARVPMRRRALEPASEEVLAARRRKEQPPRRTAAPRRAWPLPLGSRQELRRAIVLMTVLGPPRAVQPYDDVATVPRR